MAKALPMLILKSSTAAILELVAARGPTASSSHFKGFDYCGEKMDQVSQNHLLAEQIELRCSATRCQKMSVMLTELETGLLAVSQSAKILFEIQY